MPKQQTIFDKFVRNKEGQIALGQYPNVPISGWFIFWVLAKMPVSENLSANFSTVSTGFLIVWAYLELVYGVNYFRRLLGAIVLVYLLIRVFY